MEVEYEAGSKELAKLALIESAESLDRNEATTRLQLIDTLLFKCLGWVSGDCISEFHHDGDYADYTLCAPRPMLIVEAKREGDYFELPAGFTGTEYSISNLIRNNPNLEAAINQVAGYCQKRGVQLGAVTNGHQLVIFVAVRHDKPPMDGKAVVFGSLQAMSNRFREMWDSLSKPAVQEKRIVTRLVGKNAPTIPEKLSSLIANYPGAKSRNKFQTDLKIVSELVLEDLVNAKELETRFLSECYCESGALSEFSLISRDILQARYSALFDEASPGPTTIPAVTKKGLSGDFLADSLSRRPILILGDVGVGKTTFLRHLMNIDAAAQFENAITFHLNFGVKATLALDLRVFVVNEIYLQLREEFDIDIEQDGLVRGIYNLELKRFGQGIYSGLKTSDPVAYAKHELDFLEKKLADRPAHLKNALNHIQKARRRQIIIFLDNSDQRNYDTQQEVFLIAQEIANNWSSTVFLTLRPETFHLSLRSGGTLSGYHPKAFTISPPRIDRVLEKRLDFGLKITRGEIPLARLSNVAIELKSLDFIICAFIDSLKSRRELSEAIENIAAGNIRVSLDLVQKFFGSGHVDTEKIVRIQADGGRYTIPLHEFLRAVIYGDTVHFDPTRSYVANVFDVATADPKEHFLLPLMLGQLSSWTGAGIHDGMIETSAFYARLQALGFLPEQIDFALERAHKHNLIELSGRRPPEPGKEIAPWVRTTAGGAYHVQRLVNLFAYVDAVAVDTPIFDPVIRPKMRDTQSLDERLFRAELFCTYLDKQWLLLNEAVVPFMWAQSSKAIRDDIERIRIRTQLDYSP